MTPEELRFAEEYAKGMTPPGTAREIIGVWAQLDLQRRLGERVNDLAAAARAGAAE